MFLPRLVADELGQAINLDVLNGILSGHLQGVHSPVVLLHPCHFLQPLLNANSYEDSNLH